MSRRLEQQVVWQSGRRMLALIGWSRVILGNSVAILTSVGWKGMLHTE